MPHEPAVSPQMLSLLEHVQAEYVGGSKPIYVIPDRNHPSARRYPLDVENITEWSGTHLNPAHRRVARPAKGDVFWQSQRSAILPDTTFTMDYDFYDKKARPKPGTVPRTVDEMIDQMKAEGVPLPYCAVPSRTPGNFQMTWLLQGPVERMVPKQIAAMVSYWGADPRFTNAVSWNPEYRHHHPNPAGERTRWWDEWTDQMPLLASRDDLKGPGFYRAMKEAQTGAPTIEAGIRLEGHLVEQQPRRRGRQRYGTMPLEQMHDGDHRKLRLTAEIRRKVCDHLNAAGQDELMPRPIAYLALSQFVEALNSTMAEPLTPTELDAVVKPWTRAAQVGYWSHQRGASRSRISHTEDRLLAELKWMKVSYVILCLADRHREQLGPDAYDNPFAAEYDADRFHEEFPHYRQRWYDEELAERYTGKRVHKGRLTWNYIAFVAGYWTDEVIDQATGELTRPAQPDGKGLQNLMGRATKRGYTVQDYLTRSQALDEEQAAREAELRWVRELDLPSLLSANQPREEQRAVVGDVDQDDPVGVIPSGEWFEHEGYYDDDEEEDNHSTCGGYVDDPWEARAWEDPDDRPSVGGGWDERDYANPAALDRSGAARHRGRAAAEPPIEDDIAHLLQTLDGLEAAINTRRQAPTMA